MKFYDDEILGFGIGVSPDEVPGHDTADLNKWFAPVLLEQHGGKPPVQIGCGMPRKLVRAAPRD